MPGLRAAEPWTNREGTSAHAVPESLVVLGGGPVGCELATAWKALGADVTVVLQEERPLANMETFAGDAVLGGLRGLGVWVVTEEKISAVAAQSRRYRRRDARRWVRSCTRTSCSARPGANRAPPTSGWIASVSNRATWLHVDDRMRVQGIEGGWLFAAGDVTHRALLTHMGKYQARVCGDVIAADDPEQVAPAIADSIGVTQVVFTDPEVASAGLTERAARERGLRVDVVDFELGEIAGARLFADDYKGRARIVIDADRRVLVGATFVGKGVGGIT